MQHKLAVKRPLIMGIINVTPDSFSGDGLLQSDRYVQAALDQAQKMVDEGADILDIGGESTRPGSIPISAEEEIQRIHPVMAAIKQKLAGVLLSVDTMKSKVAEVALDHGATIINDVSALSHDPLMASLAAERGAYLILMHNRSSTNKVTYDAIIGGEYGADEEDNILDLVSKELMMSVTKAKKSGVQESKIILDPGLGFGKTLSQNLALMNGITFLKELGYPLMIGPSRKSFIARVLEVSKEERLEGTAAAVAIGALKGADILRVHDVRFMARVAKMAAAIAQN